ncbi:hypothetical protein [Streptosporangium sp. CA-115845]|uniref:hypothetical protein n=1 Tax=Streptosporangium sp. CA-115845 TaxID=3240071 RepID=UPI003D8F72C9
MNINSGTCGHDVLRIGDEMGGDPRQVRRYHLRPGNVRELKDNVIAGLRKLWALQGLATLGAVALWVVGVMVVSPLLFPDPLWPGGFRRSGLESGLCLAGSMVIASRILRPWK